MEKLNELSIEVEKETTCLTNIVNNFEKEIQADLIKFSLLKNDEERLNFVDKHNLKKFINIHKRYSRKDSELSEKYRGEGNGSFKVKKFSDALLKYNLAIKYAPFEGNILAMALGNRSAVYFRVKMYDECIRDIDRALYLSYPKTLSYKLYYRKYKCFLEKKNFKRCFNCLQEFKESLKDASIDIKERNSLEKSYENDIKKIRNFKDKESKENLKEMSIKPLDENIVIKTSKSRGRYLVSKTNLAIGEILGEETPLASVLYEEYYDTNCYGCQRKFISLLPCRNCANVVYCSIECEEKSWNNFHEYECEYMEFLSYSWMSRIGLLALRAFMTNKRNISIDMSNLISHDNERQSDVILQFTVLAKILEEICVLNGFVQPDERRECGKTLLNLLKICQCNCYGISEMFGNSFRESKPKDVGVALYKTASFFNHSCNPDVDIIFQGSTAFFKAIKSVKVGKEVCVDYGYVYTTDTVQLRRAALSSQYYFECECLACRENWPVFDYQESSIPSFKCSECDTILDITDLKDERFATCLKCKKSQDIVHILGLLQDSHERYASGLARAACGDMKSGLEDMINHLSLTEKFIAPPFKDFSSCQAAVKQCLRLMAEN